MYQSGLMFCATGDNKLRSKKVADAKQDFVVASEILLNIAKASKNEDKVRACKYKLQDIITKVFFFVQQHQKQHNLNSSQYAEV